MTKKQAIKLFEEKNVRTVWDDEQEKWYFCVVDVVEVLTESKDPSGYIKKMRQRDPELAKGWGQIVTPLSVQTAGGKQKMNCADIKGIFRIVQTIPSSKAEPLKQWMAQVASERLDQMQDPEKSIDQAIIDYKRLGYSDAWINQRIKSIEVRKELTDEWQRTGVHEGLEYASLTDIITREWSGFTTKQYKHHKGLKKENLRDNMTNLEIALNILAEASATELSKERDPRGYNGQVQVAKEGGSVAKAARNQLESKLGRSVISKAKASDYLLRNKDDIKQYLQENISEEKFKELKEEEESVE